MKRLVLTLVIAMSFISFSSFANKDVEVSPAALEAFKNSFKNAIDVNWTAGDAYYKAEFSLNGQFVAAYFGTDGHLFAMTRNISSIQLPITLQANLKNSYENYWISDLFEVSNDEGTTYYVTIENADTRLVLKSYAGSEWSTYKKIRKS